jgi:hypothetical protein
MMSFWMRLVFTLLVFLWVGFATCACQPGNTSDEKKHQVQPVDSSKQQIDKSQEISGFYFGTSQSQSEEIAWFLKIDFESKTGSLYMPPEVLKLSIVKSDETNQFSFRSNTGFGDVIYEFKGEISRTGMRGTIYQIYPDSKNNQTFEVLLQRFTPDSLSGSNDTEINGMYSNVKYIEDSGDLFGKELILISTSDGFVGLFTPFEGVPTTQYALMNIKRNENNLQFSLQTKNGIENYTGKILDNRIMLKHINRPNGSPEVLLKNKSLSETLNLQRSDKPKSKKTK